jgi:Flp pilus assembly protein TadB
VQPLTVPDLCLAHLQWLSTHKPKKQKTKNTKNQETKKPKNKKTKKNKKKRLHTPRGGGQMQSVGSCLFGFFCFFCFFGFLVWIAIADVPSRDYCQWLH